MIRVILVLIASFKQKYISLYVFHVCETQCKHMHATDTTSTLNALRPRQNGRHFADDIFKCIFLNENVWISQTIPLKFIPNVRNNNIPALAPTRRQAIIWTHDG